MSWLISLTRPPSLPPNALTCMWGKGIAGLYVRGPNIYFFFFPNDLQKFSLSRCEIHLSLLSTRLYAPEKDLWVAEVGIHDWTLRRHPPSWYCYSGNWSDCKRAWYWSYTDCKQAHGQTCTQHIQAYYTLKLLQANRTAYYNNLESLWHIPEKDWRDDASVRRATTWHVRSVKTRATTRAPKHTTGAMQT
jgi:hypothetical protein